MKFKNVFKRKEAGKDGAGCSVSRDGKSGQKEGQCGTCSVKSCPDREKQGQEKNRNLEQIKNKIVVLSGKGGVGKSTVAANVAVALASEGRAVGLLDVDVHGPSIPRVLGLSAEKTRVEEGNLVPVLWENNLKVMSLGFLLPDDNEAVIWRGPVKMGLIKQFVEEVDWGELDYLIVDCPPGTGDEPLSVLQVLGNDAKVLIVTTPQGVAVDDVRRSVTFCRKVGNPVLGIVENMSGFVCPKCNEVYDIFGAGGGKDLAEEMDVPFMGAIPLDPQVRQSGDSGKVYVAGGHGEVAGRAMEEIMERIEKSC